VRRRLGDFLSRLKAFHRVLSDLLDTPEDLRSLALSTVLDAERAAATLQARAVALATTAEAASAGAAGADGGKPAARSVPGKAGGAAPAAPSPSAAVAAAFPGWSKSQPSTQLSLKQAPPSHATVTAIAAALNHVLTATTEACLSEFEDVAEVLLESYLAEIEGVISRSKLLREDLEAGENQLNLVLANNRNRLLKTEIGITTVTMCMTACAVVSGYMGMNLANGLEDSFAAFLGVTIGTTGGAMLVAVLLGLYLRSILR